MHSEIDLPHRMLRSDTENGWILIKRVLPFFLKHTNRGRRMHARTHTHTHMRARARVHAHTRKKHILAMRDGCGAEEPPLGFLGPPSELSESL